MMNALAEIWRPEPLTDQEQELLRVLYAAHGASVHRNNMSTVAMLNAGIGSANYANGIAAACLSIGGPHAPLAATMILLSAADPTGEAEYALASGWMVPGWGNSFVKGKPDDAWLEVDAKLAEFYPDLHGKIADITKCLHKAGKMIFPNPSAYTAAVALALRLPPFLAPYLFIAGRLNDWTKLLWERHQ